MGRWRARWWGGMLAVVACGPSVGAAGSGTEADSGGESASSQSAGAATNVTGPDPVGTSTTSADTADVPDRGELPVCGDGRVEGDERCDDGNTRGGDECSADCRNPRRECATWGLVLACGDTIDDDGDGLVDLDDPDCLSACDDAEDLFSMQLPADQTEHGTDCYWDTNGGQGDDGCWHDLRCDPASPAAPYFPYEPATCANEQPPSRECVAWCGPLTPNGCDCYGCCLVDGRPTFLGIFSQGYDEPPCAHDATELCNPCTIEPSCFNPCDAQACELCFVQDPDELAPDCPEPSCPAGVTPCTDPYACGDGMHCAGGCCLADA